MLINCQITDQFTKHRHAFCRMSAQTSNFNATEYNVGIHESRTTTLWKNEAYNNYLATY